MDKTKTEQLRELLAETKIGNGQTYYSKDAGKYIPDTGFAENELSAFLRNNAEHFLELLEAARLLQRWLPCGPGVKAEEIEAWANFLSAFDEFEGGG